ncbi:hypothetical protein [Cedecea colo]|uniref:Uncharacterized protein n=1 Tax=Cedecea colo TaxID=2552946 RepID=A0ABX0VLY6_9ENTR|nr:hypothetical protein [Cedecea colo]NIY48079.1 hypothetical protein [Cedecea colo]
MQGGSVPWISAKAAGKSKVEQQSIGQIFDREKDQQKIQESQLISDIGTQASDIARTEDAIATGQ